LQFIGLLFEKEEFAVALITTNQQKKSFQKGVVGIHSSFFERVYGFRICND
jgi:hypothetical protein